MRGDESQLARAQTVQPWRGVACSSTEYTPSRGKSVQGRRTHDHRISGWRMRDGR